MTVFRIPERLVFPDPRQADASGLLGVGGDLTPGRLLLGYRSGIFPWYSKGQPILWWSPDPRMVLFPDDLHVPRSLGKIVRRLDYRVTLDGAFERVIQRCASTPRPGQDGTWITNEMLAAYRLLHELGFAHSCEAWRGDELVGGLYGVAVGTLFSGESMFADAPDASKVAFVRLMDQLRAWEFGLVDCQVHTAHLERFGAVEVPREVYLDAIRPLVDQPGHPGKWRFDEPAAPQK